MTSVNNQRWIPGAFDKTIKYSPCLRSEAGDGVSIGSRQDIGDEDTASGASITHRSENGPRTIPGTNPAYHTPSKSIGERLSVDPQSDQDLSRLSPVYLTKLPYLPTPESISQRSLYDYVKPESVRPAYSQDSLPMTKIRTPESSTSRGVRKQRRKEIDSKFRSSHKSFRDILDSSTTTSTDKNGCKWTFVFDPSGRFIYWWSSIVSFAFIYNFWVVIYRFAFQEINADNMAVWFTLDYTADLIYAFDIAFHFRTGFLQDGVLQTDTIKLRLHYMNSSVFYIDCLCMLPLDFLYLSIGFRSIVRALRLAKIYRFWAFLDRTERHTNYPNLVRTFSLMHYLLALFHWNACLLYTIGDQTGEQDAWKFPKDKGVTICYLHALYWSIMCLTNIGGLPDPTTAHDYIFVIFELIFGLVLFAAALGHVAAIVASVGAARKEFQARLDGVKTYMSLRGVPLKLQDRVIKWFDYLWVSNKSADEERMLKLLPDKLKAEIAIHVHLDTLQRVEIFQNTESGFLCELVLRLKPVLFSPGDYICRKGEHIYCMWASCVSWFCD